MWCCLADGPIVEKMSLNVFFVSGISSVLETEKKRNEKKKKRSFFQQWTVLGTHVGTVSLKLPEIDLQTGISQCR